MPISLTVADFSLGLLGLLLGALLGIVVHETGHLAGAYLGGMPIRLARFGQGPLLARWRREETEYELRLLPLTGCVKSFPLLDFHRGQRVLFILGGPLASIALLWALVSPGIGLVFDNPLWVGLAIPQILIITFSIIPSGIGEGEDKHVPDMLGLLNLWRKPPVHARPFFEGLLSRYRAKPSARPGASAFGARIVHRIANAPKLNSAAERQRSILALERELQRSGLSEGEELLVLDTLITRALIGDPAPPEKMEAWSKRAFALRGDLPTVRGSRGAALVALGRYEEGKAMLDSVPVGPDADTFDVLMTKIFLAQALSGLGERDEARRLLDEAFAFSKTLPAAEGIESLLQKAYAALGGS